MSAVVRLNVAGQGIEAEVRADAGAGHRAKKAITIPAAVVGETVPITISDGSREEFTTFPWLKVLIAPPALLLFLFLLKGFFKRSRPEFQDLLYQNERRVG